MGNESNTTLLHLTDTMNRFIVARRCKEYEIIKLRFGFCTCPTEIWTCGFTDEMWLICDHRGVQRDGDEKVYLL